ncbi:phage major capsid protein [Aureliella helgolandensis]|uniref:Phage capsid family protein n=1 Tax=Aureliella helgolandensis TaxID=2527968 RepID=A0A518G735_9BACT|nr:phage major capsid protein [Aureliella helgolandensis]QDV24393.1 Phage capsid family protein [Aureliella helgolandensis]
MTKKTLSLEELRTNKKKLGAELRKHITDYNERRKDGKEGWPEETRGAYEAVSQQYDENEKALIEASNDDEMATRMESLREDEETSRRTGNRPGLDDKLPGEERSYGDAGLDRDGASEYAKRQNDKRLAFRSWLAVGMISQNPKILNDEMRAACQRNKFDPMQANIEIPLLSTEQHRAVQLEAYSMTRAQRQAFAHNGEMRALSKYTSAAGAELVPQSFVTMLEMAMLAHGDFLNYVDTLTTQNGEATHWPIVDDTANEGAWVAVESEDTQVIGEPNPTFARLSWDAHELHSKWIKVPMALDEDSLFNMEMILAMVMGERLGRSINRSATTGNGTKQCKGITLDAPTGHTTAAQTAIALDDIIGLEHSVDPAYRDESQYMFHDNILKYLRLLKDLEGRQLWQQSMRDGQPDKLNNKPYAYNQHMANTVAATEITAIFGRLSDYKLRRVKNVRVVRANERFVEKLQIGFLGYIRVDGKLMRPTADAQTAVKKMVQKT